ncbi:putative leucine-rich repeat-containing protein DDB_G0290503 [Alosa sapidissima]|uniref:putative leucine-rich repeat-containing protein DDB_G0290503 n=1 Tax=Alosa sapidissima TaxID=34773 RepID=UPI001C0A557C|nr:putative leucine-rich repeat-containing protein DDB_G0290503 [Alosa sapidissima]
MLKRSLSDPCGLAGVGLVREGYWYTGTLPSGEQSLTTRSGSIKPRFLVEHGHSVPGKVEDSHEKAEETTKDNDTLQFAEEEEIWNSSDLDPQAKRLIVDLLHHKNRLMKANNGLQMALNTCEDSKIDLENENTSLKIQIKRMQKAIHGSEKLREEMDEIQAALEESKKTNHCLKASNNQLEKEANTLSHQIVVVTEEMSDILSMREMDKKKITTLTQHLRALEQQLEEARMLLDDNDGVIYNKDVVINQQKSSIEELTTIGQHLREKVKDLENQLNLAVAHGGGSFLYPDGSLSVVTENRFSLAEELGLISGFHEESYDDVEVDEVLISSGVTSWELKLGEVEEDSSLQEMDISPVKVIKVNPEELREVTKPEEVVEKVTRNDGEKHGVHVDEGEGMRFVETVEHENIVSLEEGNVTVRIEEEEVVRLELQAEFSGLEDIKREEVRELIRLVEENDLMKMDDSSLLAEEACHHGEVKPAFGHQEDRDIQLEMKMSRCESEKLAIAHPEKVLQHDGEREEVTCFMELEAMAVEVEQTQTEQNSGTWLDEKITRGALITGAIGLGVYLLWKIKS